MLRFAPSTTTDLHLGDLRIALLTSLAAKNRGEELLIRLENSENEKEILDILSLFDIPYSQIIHQSQNFRFHAAMALDLLHKKKAFTCFCSDEWLAKKKEEAQTAQEMYQYDDACRNLPAELVIDNTAPFTIRIVRPTQDIILHDLIEGDVHFKAETIDSFIIMNQDKTPTPVFATAVDDMLNDISLVIQTQKEKNLAPKQEYIRKQLGYDKNIDFVHISTLDCDETISVKTLLQEGFLPEAIKHYLLSIGNVKEWLPLDNISSETFDEKFNKETLRQINQDYLRKMDPKELSRYVGFADADIGSLAQLYLNDVATTKELKSKIEPIFAKRDIPETLTDIVTTLASIIKKAPYFENFQDFQDYLIKNTTLSKDEISRGLYIILVNEQTGPEIDKIYTYLKNYLGELVK